MLPFLKVENSLRNYQLNSIKVKLCACPSVCGGQMLCAWYTLSPSDSELLKTVLPTSPSCSSFPPNVRNGPSHQLWFHLKTNYTGCWFLSPSWLSICKTATAVCKVHLSSKDSFCILILTTTSLPTVPYVSPTSSSISSPHWFMVF